jgi:hypothetical protein
MSAEHQVNTVQARLIKVQAVDCDRDDGQQPNNDMHVAKKNKGTGCQKEQAEPGQAVLMSLRKGADHFIYGRLGGVAQARVHHVRSHHGTGASAQG